MRNNSQTRTPRTRQRETFRSSQASTILVPLLQIRCLYHTPSLVVLLCLVPPPQMDTLLRRRISLFIDRRVRAVVRRSRYCLDLPLALSNCRAGVLGNMRAGCPTMRLRTCRVSRGRRRPILPLHRLTYATWLICRRRGLNAGSHPRLRETHRLRMRCKRKLLTGTVNRQYTLHRSTRVRSLLGITEFTKTSTPLAVISVFSGSNTTIDTGEWAPGKLIHKIFLIINHSSVDSLNNPCILFLLTNLCIMTINVFYRAFFCYPSFCHDLLASYCTHTSYCYILNIFFLTYYPLLWSARPVMLLYPVHPYSLYRMLSTSTRSFIL